MNIVRGTNDLAGLEPSVLETLYAVDGQPSFHIENGFRPAVGIYNISMYQVWRSFIPVLEELEAIITNKPFLDDENRTWHESLVSRHETLLYSLMEHIEACENIIRGFFPKTEKKAGKKAVEAFNHSIREYRGYLAPIVNGIKHHQLRLHTVVNYNENAEVVGYFVVGPDEQGTLGPAASVHSEGGEAYSFNWDLRYHFLNIYLLGTHLANAVCALRTCGSVRSDIDKTHDGLIATIAERISRLPHWVFFNEIGAQSPAINVERKADSTKLTIEYPPTRSDQVTIMQGRVRCDILGDGVSTGFRVPKL